MADVREPRLISPSTRVFMLQNVPVEIETSSMFGPTPFSFVAAACIQIQSGDVVVDAGAGSGVLSILAAKLGASKVIAIEREAAGCELIVRNCRLNGVGDLVQVTQAAIEDIDWPAADVVLSNPPTMPASNLVPVLARAEGDRLAFLRSLLSQAAHSLWAGHTLQLVVSSLVRPDAQQLLGEASFELVSESQFVLPFRPYYYQCFSRAERQDFLRQGRAISSDATEDSLSEVVAFLHMRHQGRPPI